MEIFVNGQALDLYPSTSVPMVFVNNLLDADVLQGSFSYPFTLPASARNRLILGFPEIVENVINPDTEMECLLVYEALAIRAKMKVRDVKADSYSFNLFTQLGAVADQLRNSRLPSLELEKIAIPSNISGMTLTFLPDTTPPLATDVIDFVIRRYNGDKVYYPTLWPGSSAALVAQLADRINLPVRKPVPNYDANATYNKHDLVRDLAGNIWECGYDGTRGTLPANNVWESTRTYQVGEIVSYSTTAYYIYLRAVVQSTNGDRDDPAVWEEVPYGVWNYRCTAAEWPYIYRRGFLPDYWQGAGDEIYRANFAHLNQYCEQYYRYDDPVPTQPQFDRNRADAAGETLYLLENEPGAPIFDYMSIWAQDFGAVSVQDGFQTVDPSSAEANYNLFVRRFFDRALAGIWPATTFSLPSIYNPGAFDDEAFQPAYPFVPYVNYYLSGRYQSAVGPSQKRFFSPCTYMGYVLDEVFKALGLDLDAEAIYAANANFRRLIIYSNRAATMLVRTPTQGPFLMLPFEVDLADHVPDIPFGEFINALRQFFFWGFIFDLEAKSCRVVTLKSILENESVKDWTLKAEAAYKLLREDTGGYTYSYTHDSSDEYVKERLPDTSGFSFAEPVDTFADLPATAINTTTLYLVRQEQVYYRQILNSDFSFTWQFFSVNLLPYAIGEGKTKVQPKVAPVLTDARHDDTAALYHSITDRTWLTPHVAQKVAIREMLLDNKPSLRLFYYWGFQNDSRGEAYPFASAFCKNYAGDTLGGPTLRFDGEDGLIATYGAEWLNFLQNTKKVTRSVRMTSLDVKYLSAADKIQIDGVNYLWRSCKITFPITKPAELELWKL